MFVSCFLDITDAVEVIQAAVDDLNRRLPRGNGWDVFYWAKSDTVWIAVPWQEYINRSSDPHCHPVICLLGE